MNGSLPFIKYLTTPPAYPPIYSCPLFLASFLRKYEVKAAKVAIDAEAAIALGASTGMKGTIIKCGSARSSTVVSQSINRAFVSESVILYWFLFIEVSIDINDLKLVPPFW